MNGAQFNEKIVEVSKTIFSYCMAKTPTREEAEDLCQDILYELVKSSKNIRNQDAFYGFMWTVAGNVYRQWCRKRAKIRTCELTDDIPAEVIINDDENTDIYFLRRELSLLSEKYRRATILYYIDRKSCAEIAHILAISESMVKYLLFKSRKILKEGMSMERKLGSLSYNPKIFVPLYMGSGPNHFWDFMQSKIRQNIVSACYNDSLTAEQISLETGIPLPYLDDDIKALVAKQILIKDGTHYKANIIIITSECTDEINRNAASYHHKIADSIRHFIETNLENFKQISFTGADFSDNTLHWQLMTFVLAAITLFQTNVLDTNDASEFPETAWGDHAYLWLVEKDSGLNNRIFNFSQENSRQGDRIHFFDYLPHPKGDHHDFYGNTRYVNILCDIARGHLDNISAYELEAVAEMIRKGYVVKENNTYQVTMPVFTMEQYAEAVQLARKFVSEKLGEVIQELDQLSIKILNEHTPKYLQKQVPGIAGADRFVHAACIPISILVDRKFLNTNWNPLEMPTTFVVLNQ